MCTCREKHSVSQNVLDALLQGFRSSKRNCKWSVVSKGETCCHNLRLFASREAFACRIASGSSQINSPSQKLVSVVTWFPHGRDSKALPYTLPLHSLDLMYLHRYFMIFDLLLP